MSHPVHELNLQDVGAQDPSLRNSPIANESDEDYLLARQAAPEGQRCIFNNASFEHQVYVRSGGQILQCRHGLWLAVEFGKEA